MRIKDITIMSMLLALLIITSKISINIGIINLTLQTFSVILISLFLKWKRASIIFLAYIIMGLIGIPVFSDGGGIYYIFKPSFGFILGFFASSFVVGSNLFENKKIASFIKAILGLLIINIFGVFYMIIILNLYMNNSYSFYKILMIGVIPFIIKDLLSVSLSALISLRLKEELNNILNVSYNNQL